MTPEADQPADGAREPEGMSVSTPPRSGQPSLAALFLLCLRIGLVSFGGGLTGWFYREFVLVRGWVSDEEFAGSYAMSQMLPGPSVANLMICIGDQLRGPMGALTCLTGLIIGPFFGVIALSVAFDSVTDIGLIQATSNGVAFTAIGLMMVVCLRGIQRAVRTPPAVLIVAATAIAVGVLHWPLVPVAIAMSTIGVSLAWRRLKHA